MGDVIDLIDKRIDRCKLILRTRTENDWNYRMGDLRAYRERELLRSQLAVLESQHKRVSLNLFEEFALQTIEVNLGLKTKAVWLL
jgi:hypothetical protein